jgi:hypothetical protein
MSGERAKGGILRYVEADDHLIRRLDQEEGGVITPDMNVKGVRKREVERVLECLFLLSLL